MNPQFDLTEYIKLALAVLGLSGTGLTCGVGCATATPQNFEETKQFVDLVQDVAEKNDAAWSVDLELSGAPAVGQETRFFFDAGIKGKAHIQGNAGSTPNGS